MERVTDEMRVALDDYPSFLEIMKRTEIGCSNQALAMALLQLAVGEGGCEDVVFWLVRYVVMDINAVLPDGSTVLHHAAVHGDVDIIMVLMANGADANALDRDGMTPIQLASTRDAMEEMQIV